MVRRKKDIIGKKHQQNQKAGTATSELPTSYFSSVFQQGFQVGCQITKFHFGMNKYQFFCHLMIAAVPSGDIN